MLISASRRTVIPAYYSEWFINRIRAGYAAVPNPFNPNQISQVSLLPKDVDAIVFSTRNPRPLFPHLDELDARGFQYYFLITILGNPREIDPKSPSLDAAIDAFQTLATRIGPERVIWRYDPIVFSNQNGVEYHLENYCQIAQSLQGSTYHCIISIMDDYAKAINRLRTLKEKGILLAEGSDVRKSVEQLAPRLVEIAKSVRMQITSCAETFDLSPYGILPGKCMDDELVYSLFGRRVSNKKDSSQRKACCCAPSKDIGMYNSCLFGCLYCYATQDFSQSAKNYRRHDPQSPSLLGWYDVQKQDSFQPSLFDQLHD